jgi:hypothetical protein
MKHRSLALLFVLGLAASGPASAGDGDVLKERLATLTPMLGLKLHKREQRALREAADDPRPEVRALAVALLYAVDPDSHAHELSDVYAVGDAEAPRLVAPGEVDARVAELVEACGGDLPKEVEPLLAFLAYKDDAAACFDTATGPTSVARFYRNAFLSLAWAEAESRGRVDRKRVLHAIDHPGTGG